MTMEKRGVIDESTPSGGCCGGKPNCNQQMLLKFGEAIEPATEKEADDMASGSITDAIDAVVEETDKSTE